MIPHPITLGHLLMLAGLLVGLYGVFQLASFLANRSHGRGTPQYARARDGRRYAAWALIGGALLFAAGCLTPLATIAIA